MFLKKEKIRVVDFQQFVDFHSDGRTIVKFISLTLDSKEKIIVYPSNHSGYIALKNYPFLFMAFQEAVKRNGLEEIELTFQEYLGQKISFEALLFNAIKKEAVQRLNSGQEGTVSSVS